MKTTHPTILLVDDDRDLLQLIEMRLRAAGYAVATATSAEAALAQLALTRPRAVITDLRMAGMDGLGLFDAIHERAPTLPVVILTAHGTIPDAVSATQRGVFGFLSKPFDGKVLLDTVAAAVAISDPGAGTRGTPDDEFVTCSPLMHDVLAQARRVAGTEANVCISGPSGSGKELLARAIHRQSGRAARAFVAVNCAAIPEGLLESELFGHRRGAFTGAAQAREGLVQAAHGGTLFLDEIGDMTPSLQAKLLRVLEERAVRPIGANEALSVDVRIVSATHRRLEDCIAAGTFREDLYYRLNVVRLTLPPLASRREDIPLLANRVLDRLRVRYGRRRLALAPEALELLIRAPWPGNVRQLANVLEQLVALASSDLIPATAVRQALDAPPAALQPLDAARRAFERDYLVQLLKITEGNVTRAARMAGRNRTEFYRLLERHALAPSMFKRQFAT